MICRGLGRIAERGRQVEFGDQELGAKLFDTGHGHSQVLVFFERDADQSLKFLVFKEVPPGQIGEGFRGCWCQAPGVPGRRLRFLVVRAHHAGAERQDGHRGEHPAIHVSELLVSAHARESRSDQKPGDAPLHFLKGWAPWALDDHDDAPGFPQRCRQPESRRSQ